jgi:hypothetical protein
MNASGNESILNRIETMSGMGTQKMTSKIGTKRGGGKSNNKEGEERAHKRQPRYCNTTARTL